MGEKSKPTWKQSFDAVVFGKTPSHRRFQPDREAKFDNRYGKGRPAEQTPQDGTGLRRTPHRTEKMTNWRNSSRMPLVTPEISSHGSK